jgi:hypothetical protein
MKSFDEFIKLGAIKKRGKDDLEPQSIIREAEDRLSYYNKLPLDEKGATYVTENLYEVIRGLLDAKLLKEGFKSYSHEATVSYLAKLNFPLSDIIFLDELQKIRNQIKYTGFKVDLEYSKKVSKFVNRIYKEILKKI